MNEFGPQTESVESSKYGYIRGFASRLCLVLERYIAIPGYAMQAPEPLEEAIVFFRIAKGKFVDDPLERYFDPSVVNLGFVRDVLVVLSENVEVVKTMNSLEFCDFAISTLTVLLNTPKRASKEGVLTVHDFFCTTEIVLDRLPINSHTPVFLASLAS